MLSSPTGPFRQYGDDCVCVRLRVRVCEKKSKSKRWIEEHACAMFFSVCVKSGSFAVLKKKKKTSQRNGHVKELLRRLSGADGADCTLMKIENIGGKEEEEER